MQPTHTDGLRAHRADDSELVRAIVDTSPFATIAFDVQGRIIFWNAGAERMFGWRADEVTGRPFPQEAIPDDERPSSRARIQRTLEGALIDGERVRRLTRDGRELILEIHGGPIHDRSGETVGYAGQMVDVTLLQDMAADLALVANVGSLLAGAVASLGPDATLEHAAQVICDQLGSLPLVDFTAIGAFEENDQTTLLASHAPQGFPLRSGDCLPAHRSAKLFLNAQTGPWAERWESTNEDGDWGRLMDTAGLKAFAFGPIIHGDHVDGGVVIGTRDPAFARTLVEKWASVVDFSTTASVLLADRLHARRRQIASRRVNSEILAGRAFDPVFQPIVEFSSGDVVGHEALTRFRSGERTDACFAEAWAVGLGADLEFETLVVAIDAARHLPPGRWLDLNVSPRLFDDPTRLRATLASADRPLVLEVTEHEAIGDYGVIRDIVRSLGSDVRLAVDDAGAGVANFHHIVELGPDFVKLDRGLVRKVNTDLGRQAVVVGMRHFARTAGCRLIAEGIETADEARTLRALGVEFGQGFWFGPPVPVTPD